jgi:hypothetical protein
MHPRAPESLLQKKERYAVNHNELFESRWEQVRTQSRQWWSLFSEEDLDKVENAPIKRDKYVMMLQVKYGYTRDFAREEITRRLADLQASPPSSEAMVEALSQRARATTKARAGKTRRRPAYR